MTDPQTFTFPNRVKKTYVAAKNFVGEVEVSTIRSPGGSRAGFETVVFDGPKTEYGSSPQWLYNDEAEALAHHDAIVEALRKGEPIPDERTSQ